MDDIFSLLMILTTFFMTGVIWVVQISVYPALRYFEKEGFGTRHDHYRNRIAMVVTIPMFIELFATIYAVAFPFEWLGGIPAFLLLLILSLIWISTLLIQVPQHERLSIRKDERAIDALVRGNWVRTGLWSLRSAVLFVYLMR